MDWVFIVFCCATLGLVLNFYRRLRTDLVVLELIVNVIFVFISKFVLLNKY